MRDDLTISGRESIADWIETTVLARRQSAWAVDSVATTALEELGLNEASTQGGLLSLSRRQKHLGDDYPFVVDDLAIRRKKHAMSMPYTAFLLLTANGTCRQLVHKTSTSAMERAFEDLVALAMRSMWGRGSFALRFGWPSEEGRPPEFDLAIVWLAKRMGLPIGSGYRPPRRKDGGVDVVAWRPFPDGKSGFPIVLIQCTLQTDITNKAADVDKRLWSSWLVLDVDPVTALAVPEVVPSGEQWNEITLQSMLLDRIRLTGLCGSQDLPLSIHVWCADSLESLSTRLAGAEQK